MNNDLISRSALKDDLQDRLRKARNWKENAINRSDDEIIIRADATINFICEVIMTIDNAPTVRNEYKRAECEWIFLGDNPNRDNPNSNHKYACSNCGRGVKEQENFCPNCGVKMKWPWC